MAFEAVGPSVKRKYFNMYGITAINPLLLTHV